MRRLLFLSLAALLAAGPGCVGNNANTSTAAKTAPVAGAPDANAVANTEYSGIYDYAVRLSDGRFEGEPFVEGGASRPTVTLVDRLSVEGDLDGDGQPERAVLLSENSGGSGVNLYLAVVTLRGGLAVNTGTAFVGNRIQVRDLEIVGRAIVLDVVQAGPADAMCCPTQMAQRRYKLDADGLSEQGSNIVGTFSLAVLDGSEWKLDQFSRTDLAPGEPPITLAFADGRISGKSACNRYFAAISPGDGDGSVKIGQAGSTMMACTPEVMALEKRYLGALAGVDKLGFVAGRLALGYTSDGTRGSLLFSPLEPE
jgi:heat shock protein HslJ